MALIPTDPSLERSFRGHKGDVTSVAFSPTMKQLVSGSADHSVMVRALTRWRPSGSAQRPCVWQSQSHGGKPLTAASELTIFYPTLSAFFPILTRISHRCGTLSPSSVHSASQGTR